jgi:hypothetical protein
MVSLESPVRMALYQKHQGLAASEQKKERRVDSSDVEVPAERGSPADTIDNLLSVLDPILGPIMGLDRTPCHKSTNPVKRTLQSAF